MKTRVLLCAPPSVCGAHVCAGNTFEMCTRACHGLNVIWGVYLDCLLFCLLKQGLLQGLEFTNFRLLLLLHLSLTLITELQVATSAQLFPHGFGEVKSDPHVEYQLYYLLSYLPSHTIMFRQGRKGYRHWRVSLFSNKGYNLRDFPIMSLGLALWVGLISCK